MAKKSQTSDDDYPGWDAIDAACRRVYGKEKPLHFGSIIKYVVGGPDPIDGTSIYRNGTSHGHWHYVTYGFTELYRKETKNRRISGFGFELTFRLACRDKDKKPPDWPIGLLNNIARYVFNTGRVFTPGHHLDCNSPIALEKKTDLRALLFTLDPQLGEIDTPHGHVQFLQIVGITSDELDVSQEWNTTGLLEVLSRDNPLLVTDLQRKSILTEPAKAKVVQERLAKEGSSCGVIYNDSTRWQVKSLKAGDRVELTLGAKVVERFVRLLRGRILHKRNFSLQSELGLATFKPARNAGWRVQKNGELVVNITPDFVEAIQGVIRPERGIYRSSALPNFAFKVVPTEIKDDQGNVVEVIG